MGYSDFPANSQILLRLAIVNLRTVIVTAAVHWGFSSKLHQPISSPNSLKSCAVDYAKPNHVASSHVLFDEPRLPKRTLRNKPIASQDHVLDATRTVVGDYY